MTHRRVVPSNLLVFSVAIAALALVLAPSIGFAAPPAASVESIGAEELIGGPTVDEEMANQAELHAWLMRELPAGALATPLTLRLTADEQSDLKHRQEAASGGPALVGRTKALSLAVRFSGLDARLLGATPRAVAGGFLSATPDGGFVWAAAVRAEGAGALRVHLSGLNLPSDVDLFFFSPEGQAFGPYGSRGPNADGDFWTHSVFGQVGVVLLRHYGPAGADDLARVSFRITEVGHIGQAFAGSLRYATESFCSFNVSCIENASCHTGTPADAARNATALMQWISGQFIYTCTGTLLNDTVAASQIPYFLTANHCLSTNSLASNLETYFQFSLSCGSTACPGQTNPGGIQRLGATVKATGSAGDFTLLQLNQTPPSGSAFLGWNNVAVAFTNNVNLYRISHPAWAPQAWSSHRTDTSAPTCTSWPRGQRIYSRTTGGGTEGGSSGSAVLNGSSQVVGQLSGKCGTNVNNPCDEVNNATVDGALAFYWSSVQPFLDPATCSPSAEICNDGLDNDCDGFTDCADSNCNGSPSCNPTCSPAGASCTANSQCCSNKCKGNPSARTCR
jgi:hypothetical protein